MALDPRLSLEVNQRPLDTATPLYQANQTQMNNAMSTEQILKAHYEGLDAREKSRLTSTAIGASQLKTFLDAGDIEGAKEMLKRRKINLHQRMAYGENIDTQETDYAFQALERGDIDTLKNDVNSVLAAAQIAGAYDYTGGGDTGRLLDRLRRENPNLTDMEALQAIKGGAGQMGRNQADIASGREANYETQTGKNVSDVDYARQKEREGSVGKGQGEAIMKNEATLASLDNLSFSIGQARQLLPKVSMTGPIMGRIGSAAEDPDYKNLQGAINAITLQAKDLYNLGSGAGFTDTDREFLRDIIAGKYAKPETINSGLQRFDEALQHRREYILRQNQRYQGGGLSPSGPVPNTNAGTVGGGKQGGVINVYNPQTGERVEDIDPSRVAEALAEGFVVE